ncbi:LysR family transcriptional regulator [Nocardia caishijiensis]|uniref:DNA-binding transcriptional LysR family regulator n=1 Tax=Nocardia caishijiensis TaxID=184756 RepID=A0ABQ6YTZ3_9NOCA|nr:LysR family transcriptional regulator [Nocardia caishijiensis]KAF0849277.1 DNA-binding transcriptional LysR family regulator [Nocardia caishijiensis]
MERQEIEVFLALCEELHFGRAAERLYLTQARVSQTIKKLERRFGAQLFERTSRQVRLTPVGRVLRDDLIPIRAQLDRAVERAEAAARSVEGTLRVGYLGGLAASLLVDTVLVFRDRHPECEVHAREVHLSDVFGPLRRDELDLVISHSPIGEHDLIAGPALLTEPTGLVVPRDHALARRSSIDSTTAGIEVIAIGGPAGAYWHRYLDETWHISPVGSNGAHTFEDVLTAVAFGAGVHPAGAHAERHYPRRGTVYVPFSDGQGHVWRPVWMPGAETARLWAFVQMLLESVAQRGADHYFARARV